jgi:hypothetical protein
MGCSFIFVRPPPSEHEKLAYFDCVSNDAAPAVDTTNAVGDALITGLALAQHPDGSDKPAIAVVGIGGAVYLASAIYGFVNTSKCARAKESLAERVLKTQAERDQLLQAQTQQHARPAGCQRDTDCKGTRVCANALCVEPPSAPATLSFPAAPSAPVPPAEPAPPATPAPTTP